VLVILISQASPLRLILFLVISPDLLVPLILPVSPVLLVLAISVGTAARRARGSALRVQPGPSPG